ncbi:HET-domain-containing protein [Acephala macrosclerotiorum]|nr:HET-domain-containing protein [Acephala macrosclerotiorum]
MSSPPPYTYEPLQEAGAIRLVVLHPSPNINAPVHISLIPVTLSDYDDKIIGRYTALSYVWGDANDKREVLIDGHRLGITASLDSALRHLRDHRRALKVWADGICINQGDIDERNCQVMIMGKIYEFARHTIIYLGESTTEIDAVMDFIAPKEGKPVSHFESGISSNASQLVNAPQNGDCPSQSLPTSATKQRMGDESRRFLVEHILGRPWFSRVWVLQELVLSSDPWIQVGVRRIRWKVFCDYVLEGIDPPDFVGGMLTLYDMNETRTRLGPFWQNSPTRLVTLSPANTLLRVLHFRRGFGVMDPRDMIYAHLGMVPDSMLPSLLPQADYRLSASQLYTQFALYCLRETGNLSFLSQIGWGDSGGRVKEDLPSWVPDWTSFRDSPDPPVPEYVCWCREGINLLHAFHEESNVLACLGSPLDRIKTIKSGIPPLVDVKEIYAYAVSSIESEGYKSDNHGRRAVYVINSFDDTNTLHVVHEPAMLDEKDESRRFRQLVERMYAKLSHVFYTWLGDTSLPRTDKKPFEQSFRHKGGIYELLRSKLVACAISLSDPETIPYEVRWHKDWGARDLAEEQEELLSRSSDPLLFKKSVDPLSSILWEMTDVDGFSSSRRFSNWQVAVTERGELAVVPPTTLVGDLVVQLLENHRSPYILRHISRGQIDNELEEYILQVFTQRQEQIRERADKEPYEDDYDYDSLFDIRGEVDTIEYHPEDEWSIEVEKARWLLRRLNLERRSQFESSEVEGNAIEHCVFVSECQCSRWVVWVKNDH